MPIPSESQTHLKGVEAVKSILGHLSLLQDRDLGSLSCGKSTAVDIRPRFHVDTGDTELTLHRLGNLPGIRIKARS